MKTNLILHISLVSNLIYKPSGEAKVAFDIAHELSKNNINVVLFTTNIKLINNKFIPKISYYNKYFILYHSNILCNILSTYKIAFIKIEDILALKYFIKKASIVHLHGYPSLLNIIAYYFIKKYKKPYILQAHGSLFTNNNSFLKKMFNIIIGNKLLNNANIVIALSSIEYEEYMLKNVKPSKIEILPNGININKINHPQKGAFKNKLHIPDNYKILLYLGRVIELKGIDLLIESFSILNKKYDKIKLVIVGPNNEYSKKLELLAIKLNIKENVIFTGPLYNTQKDEAYNDSYVFVLPSRYDTFPMTLLEAMEYSLPLIISEYCQAANNFKSVGIISKNDPSSLSKSIEILLIDEVKYNEYKNNCKLVLNKYSINDVVKELQNIYNQQINTRQK